MDHQLDATRKQVLPALREWMEKLPDPQKPFLASLDGDLLSARDLVVAVEEGTEAGEDFLQSFESLAEAWPEIGLDGLISRLENRAVSSSDFENNIESDRFELGL